MHLLKVILTGGNVHDSELAVELLKDVTLKGKIFLADKAYSCEKIRCYLRVHGVCIPDKLSTPNKQLKIVERFFQRIKNYRHVATRYDKLALCFLNFVLLASVVIHF